MPNTSLSGLTVVNTRAIHQAAELDALLEAQGATVLSYPAIAIAPMPDTTAFEEGIRAGVDGAFDWLVVTSANTVWLLKERMAALGFPPAGLNELRIAAVGAATAEAVQRDLGLQVDLLPDEFVAEALLESLGDVAGQRIFLPQSAQARPVLAEGLQAAGAEVTQVDAYRMVTGQGGVSLGEYFWRGDVDVVTFTSASTVHNFVKRLKAENGSTAMLVDVVVACIGPITAEAARRHDLPVKVVPEEHTLEGLVEALVGYFG
jgi:uroporphyrinogen-III synthase